MSGLPRKSTVNQLSRIRKQIKKQGGDIGDKTNTKKEKTLPNSLWIDNPNDRGIDTINNHVKLEVESFSEYIKSLDELNENLSQQQIQMINTEFANVKSLINTSIEKISNMIVELSDVTKSIKTRIDTIVEKNNLTE